MKNLYAFQLGRVKSLCLTELKAVLGEENLVEHNPNTAIFKCEIENAQTLQDRLGGTIKIVEIFNECDQGGITAAIEELINQTLKNIEGKTPFAVNVFQDTQSKLINIKELLNFSKKIIKSLGLNARFVNKSQFENPKASTIYKARLIEKGIDINVIQGKDKYFVGKSVSIQNLDQYSLRDYKKPMRDAKVGMTPPKLAQIMINLAGPAETILDPFCGTGTFLMEGLLMGKTVVGSDIEEKIIGYSEKNLDWFCEKFNCPENYRVFTRDARFLTQALLPEKIDAIVTEGYLGIPFSTPPSMHEKEVEFRKLANLHLNWLTAIHPLLPEKGKVVMCLTTYKNKKKIDYFPDFRNIAKTAGFKLIDDMLYDRKDQVVARDIKILEKI